MSIPPATVQAYDQPHQFEPLLPGLGLDALALRARPVMEAALRLQGATNVATRGEIRALVRSMNSYYSNRIEGQSTHPLNIERALKANFSDQPAVAKRQRLALAHIQAELALEATAPTEAQALHSRTLVLAHQSLYAQLSEADCLSDEGRGVEPGVLRSEDVTVARHQAPTWASVPQFLARADAVYAQDWGLDRLLVVAACAHHRLVWVHPFSDGNGRAARLQLHAVLHRLSGGLWSVNRGLARQRDAYYARLSEADMPRHGDLDGRGNLSEKMLRAWCEFFIDVCHDQVRFMAQALDLDSLKDRLAGLVLVRSQMGDAALYRPEAIVALHHVLAVGPVARGEFVQMTGLAERTGRKVLSKLLEDGLLQSDTPKGAVRIGFPLDSLHLLFPNLYPEAAAAVWDAA